MKEVKVKLLTSGDYDSLNMIELPVVVDGYTNDEGDELAFVRASTLKKIVNTAYGSDYPFFIGSECEIVNQTETPEEKEALDMMDNASKQIESLANNSEFPNSSEWKNGEACQYWHWGGREWRDSVYVTYDNGFHVVRDTEDDGYTGVLDAAVRKQESPEAKEERERLEAAYDLYCLWGNTETIDATLLSMRAFNELPLSKKWLAIADKTGYRKAK